MRSWGNDECVEVCRRGKEKTKKVCALNREGIVVLEQDDIFSGQGTVFYAPLEDLSVPKKGVG